MQLTALELAGRFLGLDEIPGAGDTPLITAMVQVVKGDMRGAVGLAGVGRLPADDETPWCSIFLGFTAYLLNLPRPARHADPSIRSLAMRARSWLTIGDPVELVEARAGYDCVVLNRAGGPTQTTVINAPGHVGLFLERQGELVRIRGGNQGNRVSDAGYPARDVLGVRRWWSGP